MKKFLKDNKYLILAFIIVFLFTLPFLYTGDDMQWGLDPITWDYLKELVKNPHVNGRYLGNLFVLMMTKNIFVRATFMATTLCGIVFIIKKETKSSYSIIWLLLLLMSPAIIAEAVVWTSGFTNYTISTLFLLLSLLTLRKCYKNPTIINGVGLFLLIIASSFFIENLTVFLVIATLTLNVLYFIRNKKVNFSLLAGFIASIMGTTLMFIQPAYRAVLTGEDTYRSYGKGIGGIISRALSNYIYDIHKYLVFENVFLMGALSLLLFIYYKVHKKRYNDIQEKILNASFWVSFAFIIYAFVARLDSSWEIVLGNAEFINSMLTLIYLVCLFFQFIMLFYKTKHFTKLVRPILVALGLVAPLLVVSPVGARNFFMIYCLELVEVLYLMKIVNFDYKKWSKFINVGLVVMVLFYTSVYVQLKLVDMKRYEYVRYISENTEDTFAYVPLLPFRKYVHAGDFANYYWAELYRTTRGIRGSLGFYFIEYEDWLEYLEEFDN